MKISILIFLFANTFIFVNSQNYMRKYVEELEEFLGYGSGGGDAVLKTNGINAILYTVLELSSGNVIIIGGAVQDDNQYPKLSVVNIDLFSMAIGVKWSLTFDSSDNTESYYFSEAILSSDEKLIITGSIIVNSGNPCDSFLMKIEPENGTVYWMKELATCKLNVDYYSGMYDVSTSVGGSSVVELGEKQYCALSSYEHIVCVDDSGSLTSFYDIQRTDSVDYTTWESMVYVGNNTVVVGGTVPKIMFPAIILASFYLNPEDNVITYLTSKIFSVEGFDDFGGRYPVEQSLRLKGKLENGEGVVYSNFFAAEQDPSWGHRNPDGSGIVIMRTTVSNTGLPQITQNWGVAFAFGNSLRLSKTRVNEFEQPGNRMWAEGLGMALAFEGIRDGTFNTEGDQDTDENEREFKEEGSLSLLIFDPDDRGTDVGLKMIGWLERDFKGQGLGVTFSKKAGKFVVVGAREAGGGTGLVSIFDDDGKNCRSHGAKEEKWKVYLMTETISTVVEGTWDNLATITDVSTSSIKSIKLPFVLSDDCSSSDLWWLYYVVMGSVLALLSTCYCILCWCMIGCIAVCAAILAPFFTFLLGLSGVLGLVGVTLPAGIGLFGLNAAKDVGMGVREIKNLKKIKKLKKGKKKGKKKKQNRKKKKKKKGGSSSSSSSSSDDDEDEIPNSYKLEKRTCSIKVEKLKVIDGQEKVPLLSKNSDQKVSDTVKDTDVGDVELKEYSTDPLSYGIFSSSYHCEIDFMMCTTHEYSLYKFDNYDSSKSLFRTMRELSRIRHPNIVSLLGISERNDFKQQIMRTGKCLFVTEHVPKESSLYQLLYGEEFVNPTELQKQEDEPEEEELPVLGEDDDEEEDVIIEKQQIDADGSLLKKEEEEDKNEDIIVDIADEVSDEDREKEEDEEELLIGEGEDVELQDMNLSKEEEEEELEEGGEEVVSIEDDDNDIIKKKKTRKINFTWPEKYEIAFCIGKALLHLHNRKLVHQDLKSSNVFITPTSSNKNDYRNPTIKVVCFKMQKIRSIKKRRVRITKTTQSSIPWIAPELINSGRNRRTKESDVYSFGMILWELASMEKPYIDLCDFSDDSYSEEQKSILMKEVKKGFRLEIPQETPIEFQRLIEGCWNKNWKKRMKVSKVLKILKELIENNGIVTQHDEEEEDDDDKKEEEEEEVEGEGETSKHPVFYLDEEKKKKDDEEEVKKDNEDEEEDKQIEKEEEEKKKEDEDGDEKGEKNEEVLSIEKEIGQQKDDDKNIIGEGEEEEEEEPVKKILYEKSKEEEEEVQEEEETKKHDSDGKVSYMTTDSSDNSADDISSLIVLEEQEDENEKVDDDEKDVISSGEDEDKKTEEEIKKDEEEKVKMTEEPEAELKEEEEVKDIKEEEELVKDIEEELVKDMKDEEVKDIKEEEEEVKYIKEEEKEEKKTEEEEEEDKKDDPVDQEDEIMKMVEEEEAKIEEVINIEEDKDFDPSSLIVNIQDAKIEQIINSSNEEEEKKTEVEEEKHHHSDEEKKNDGNSSGDDDDVILDLENGMKGNEIDLGSILEEVGDILDSDDDDDENEKSDKSESEKEDGVDMDGLSDVDVDEVVDREEIDEELSKALQSSDSDD